MPTDFTHMPIDAGTFLDRLAGGFGRVVLFLRENDAAPFREAILDACLHHRAFDRQAEGYRTDSLFDIMQAAGEPEFYAAYVRRALGGDNEDYAYGQLYELAARLARSGDAEARRVMYDRFARHAVRQETTGAEDFVVLDGLAGYLFVAEQWRRHPLPEDDPWEEVWLLEKLEKQIGQAEARQALEQAARAKPELAAHLAGVEQDRARRDEERAGFKRPPAPAYTELAERVADPKQTVRWQAWRSWAKRLDDDTLTRLGRDLLAGTDRVPLLRLLHLFRERVFPLPIDRLLDLARARDEDIAEAARWALSNLTDPRVRALALELWEAEAPPLVALDLLRNNFAPGDYAQVERMALRDRMDADEYHTLGISARRLVEANPAPEAAPTLLALYEHGRCTVCRCSAVELLLSLGPLPPWMQVEGRCDADGETRALAAKSPTP